MTQDCDRLPQSTRIAPDHPRNVVWRVYRSDFPGLDLALQLGFNAASSEASAWLSLSQARQLAAALTAHADAFEAQFPAENQVSMQTLAPMLDRIAGVRP